MLVEIQHATLSPRAWIAAYQHEKIRPLGRGWLDRDPRAIADALERDQGPPALFTLWLDFRLAQACVPINPAALDLRLDRALHYTLLGTRGLYYSNAPWGMRRVHALVAATLIDGQRFRRFDDSLREELQARWTRACAKALALPVPFDVDQALGHSDIRRLNGRAPAAVAQRPVHRLPITDNLRPVGVVAVDQRRGPLWATVRSRRLVLPSFTEVHPQFRDQARWQHTEQFCRTILHRDDPFLQLHPAGRPRPLPTPLTNETVSLRALLPTHLHSRLDNELLQRAFARTFPEANTGPVCAVRYRLDGDALYVHVSLAGVVPGTHPFIGRESLFRANLIAELQPTPAAAIARPLAEPPLLSRT